MGFKKENSSVLPKQGTSAQEKGKENKKKSQKIKELTAQALVSDDDVKHARDYLCSGDLISLFATDQNRGYHGYLYSEGFAHPGCSLQPFKSPTALPSNFRNCVFEVQWENKNSKIVRYGDAIQLFHISSGEYLSVKREASGERNCVKVSLTPNSNKTCWFRVLPRYKLRSKGEKVRYNEQILLISVNSEQYVHLSTYTLPNSHLEVNASSEVTGWRLTAFAISSEEERAQYLHGGEIISLFHLESDGYLAAGSLNEDEGTSIEMSKDLMVYLRVSKSLQRKQSALSLWQIECATPNSGDTIQWGDLCKIRHLATNKYLVVKKEGPGIRLTLQRKGVDDEKETLFFLFPVNKGEKRINFAAYLRVQHEDTEAWLHSEREFYDKDVTTLRLPSGMIPLGKRSGKLRKLSASSIIHDEDVFSIVPVEKSEAHDLLCVMSWASVLQQYTDKIVNGAEIKMRDAEEVLKTIQLFINFLTPSNDYQLKTRQTLLYDMKFLDVTHNMIKSHFDYRLKLPDITKPEYKPFFLVVKNANLLLKAIVKGNHKNGLCLARQLDFMQSQLGYGLDTSHALMEMFDNNRQMLDAITEEQILFFVTIMKKRGKLARGYIDFLAVLCTCNGTGLPKNQNIICTKLLIDNQSLIPQTKLEDGQVLVMYNKDWVPLEKYMVQADKQETECYQLMLHLYGCLCVGRNYNCITQVSSLVSYDHISVCLTNERLSKPLRTAYCNLLLCCYVDCNLQIPVASHTKVWAELSENTNWVPTVPSFHQLKVFAMNYLTNASITIDDVEGNKLTLAVLNILRQVVRGGSLTYSEDYKVIFPLLLSALEPSRASSESSNDLQRYQWSDKNHVLMEIKLQICKIIDILFSQREDYRLNKLLILYKKQFQGIETPSTTRARANSLRNSLRRTLTQRSNLTVNLEAVITPSKPNYAITQEAFTELFEDFDCYHELIPVLMDLVRYESPELNRVALSLLLKQFCQKDELVSSLTKVQLLVSEELESAHKEISDKVSQLRKLTASRLSPEGELDVNDILTRFVELCSLESVRAQNQIIMRNFEVHNDVINILHVPFDNLPEEGRMREIFRLCYRFLKHFCYMNPENQLALFPHLDFMMSQMGIGLHVADTINELCQHNSAICSKIGEQHIRHMVDLIEHSGRFARYLRFFHNVVLINRHPQTVNQNFIIRSLLERQQETIVLFNNLEEFDSLLALIAQERRAIESESPLDEEGLLLYHITLVDILAKCARGKNNFTETKCQSLVSMSDCLRIICHESLPIVVKAPWIRFFHEVYLLTEFMTNDLSADPLVWTMLGQLYELMNRLRLNVEKGIPVPEQTLGLLHTILPVLTVFYAKHYSTSKATKEQVEMSSKLMGMLRVMDGMNEFKSSWQRIAYCLQVMSQKSVKEVVTKEGTSRLLDRSKSLPKVTLPLENQIAEGLIHFTHSVKRLAEGSKEFAQLVQVFADELRPGTTVYYVLKKAIAHFSTNISSHPIPLVTTWLRLFSALLEMHLEDEEKLEQTQRLFSEIDAAKMFILLISSKHLPIVQEAVKFGVLMLRGGNSATQWAVYNYLTSIRVEFFFDDIRIYLQQAIRQLKGKKLSKKQRWRQQFSFVEEEQKTETNDDGFIKDVLLLLQQLCEGHFLPLQNYLRLQPDNIKSYDLVTETMNFLFALVHQIGPHNIGLAIQVFDTLTEFVQGPCIENQWVLAPQICEPVNAILRNEYPTCDQSLADRLKGGAVLTLLSLLEGMKSPYVPKLMVESLDFDIVKKNLDITWNRVLTQTDPEAKEKSLQAAFMYFILARVLSEHDTSGRADNVVKTCQGRDFFSRQTGRIEIIRDNQLEVVNFRIPDICNSTNFSKETKVRLLWSVDRESPSSKIRDFFEQSNDILYEIKHNNQISEGKYSWIITRDRLWQDTAFLLSAIINFFIITMWDREQGISNPFIMFLLSILSLCHFVSSTAIVFVYFKKWSSVMIHIRMKEEEEDKVPPHRITQVWYVIGDPLSFYYVSFWVCSFLGLVASPFFFAFHLLDVSRRSVLLHNVIRAVTLNGRSILLTGLLVTVIIYLYAIIGFVFFQDQFEHDGKNECQTLLMCLVNTMNHGIREGGGIGDYLEPLDWDHPMSGFRVLFDVSFFVIVITILLNVIFGIIIDTFGELRSKKENIDDDMANRCFICNIERSQFDRMAKGFEHHVEREHNMWQYLFFFLYLSLKERSEYTGQESYVDEMIKKNDLSFFPINRAICLDQQRDEKAIELQSLSDKLDSLGVAIKARELKILDVLKQKEQNDTSMYRLKKVRQKIISLSGSSPNLLVDYTSL